MTLIEPPVYQPVSGAPVVFLAGPIHFAPLWQLEAFDILHSLDDNIVVASPRRLLSVERYRYLVPAGDHSFHRQRAWERFYMELAARQGCIMFWLPRPARATGGAVYGATTRYELGLWSARYAHDDDMGLCIGTDGEFPTVHTIAYDIEMEIGPNSLHRNLGQTCKTAVHIAQERFRRWTGRGKPEVELESQLLGSSEASAGLNRRPSSLSGNPMNDPEMLRRKALALLSKPLDVFGMKSVAVEDLGDSPAPGDVEELVDLDEIEAERARLVRVRRMSDEHAWFLAGQEITGPKYLAIGRSTYYISFLQAVAATLGTPVYQSDFLDWLDPGDPHRSLSFYLETAERIDVNLEGISARDLHEATAGAGGSASTRTALRPRYMTSWEMNQIYFGRYLRHTFWHTGGSMTAAEASAVLGDRVPKERIIET